MFLTSSSLNQKANGIERFQKINGIKYQGKQIYKNTQEIILKKFGLYEMWWNLVCSRNTISEIYLLVILKEECNVNIVIYSLYVKVNIV